VTTKRTRNVIPVTKHNPKVVPFTPRRREAMDLVKFIDAHGGKLAPFRSYQDQAAEYLTPLLSDYAAAAERA